MTSTAFRLPRGIVPLDYDVSLDASPRRTAFAGTLLLTVRVLEPTAVVCLHARGLKVRTCARTGKKPATARLTPRPDDEAIDCAFEAPLAAGKHTLELTFTGKLNPSMHGLYLAKDGAERAIVSQCEATDARAIYPCFDEPDFKATLRWTITTDEGLEVITNGARVSRKKVRGKPLTVHTFERTRVISTYLSAVTIGKLEASAERRVAGVPCRVWSGPGKAALTTFAQDVTAFVLPWYQKYFGHKYNYQKLDQVAVPGFDAGAMENVGAIFYRQNLLLMAAESTSWQGRKRIAEVIAHEIAHQWFGNLVTMKWWDDLWLNEAFATWIAYKAVDTWQPAWRMWDDYLEGKQSALHADALLSTHPIYTEVKSPAEATELFDVITYEKGCAVLRMAESFLGPDVFQQGIKAYIKAFKNGNATGQDLWTHLGEAAQQPMEALMGSWVAQPGFPLVQVTVKEVGDHTELQLQQRRFFAGADAMAKPLPTPQHWQIPMVIQLDAGHGTEEHRALFTAAQGSIELPVKARWVYPNARAAGFYRVQLDPAARQALLTHGLPHLPPSARMALLEDEWAQVVCGLQQVDAFMDVLAAFGGETDYAVTRALNNRLCTLHESVARDVDRPALAAFVRTLVGPQLDAMGWQAGSDEGDEQAVRRAVLIDLLGEVGRDPAVLDRAEALVETEMHDPRSVEPHLAAVVIALAALRGDEARLKAFVGTYLQRKKARTGPELMGRYLGALSAFEAPAVAKQVLALCLTETVPQEQLRVVLSPMLARRSTQAATWTFLKANWQRIGPRVGSMGVARLVESTGALPFALHDDVQRFFTDNRVEEAQRALQKALEAMTLRHALVQREAARLGTWLAAYHKAQPPSGG